MSGIRFLILVLLVAIASPLVAQQQEELDDMVAVTVYGQAVYPHRLGWIVVYTQSDLYPGEVYLPARWFTNAGGQGQVVFSTHPSVPYMTIFYRNGEFDSIRLAIHPDPAHRSWGALQGGRDYDPLFDTDTLEIDY